MKWPKLLLFISLTAFCTFSSAICSFKPALAEGGEETSNSVYQKLEGDSEHLNVFFPQFGPRDNNFSIVRDSDNLATYSYCGDCTIIKYGTTEILIDAGTGTAKSSSYSGSDVKASADTLFNMMKDIVSGKWDIMIFTHSDLDHISGVPRLLENCMKETGGMQVSHIYDFALKDDVSTPDAYHYFKKQETEAYKAYVSTMKKFIGSTECEHHSVSALFDETGKSSSNVLTRGELKLTFLYNSLADKYRKDNQTYNSINNQNSVCFLITYNEDKLLFTGDLQEYIYLNETLVPINGETYLYNNNEKYLDGGVTFFKAAHHGSQTANSASFINKIRPAYVYVPAVAMTSEYNGSVDPEDIMKTKRFPSWEACENFFTYTDYIYLPSEAINKPSGDDATVEKIDGNINLDGDTLFQFNGHRGETIVTTANEHTPIFNQEWYSRNREPYLYAYNFADNSTKSKQSNFSLLKFGHIDIVIDCGSSDTSSKDLIEDAKKYIVDKKIEYLIVSHAHKNNFSSLVGTMSKHKWNNDGILNTFAIDNLYDFSSSGGTGTNFNYGDDGCPFYNRYTEIKNELIENNELNFGTLNSNNEWNTISNLITYIGYDEKGNQKKYNLNLQLLDLSIGDEQDENNYSLISQINFGEVKGLFLGDMTNVNATNYNLFNKMNYITYLRRSNEAMKSNDVDLALNKTKINVAAHNEYTTMDGQDLNPNNYKSEFQNSDKVYFTSTIDIDKSLPNETVAVFNPTQKECVKVLNIYSFSDATKTSFKELAGK